MKREHSYIIGALALAGAILLAEADTVKNGFVEVVGEGARANGDRDVVLHEPEDPSEVKVSTQAGWRFTDPRNAAFQHHVGATDLIHLVNESKESEATIKITDDWEHTCEKTNWEGHVSAPKLVVGGADHALILLKPDEVGVFLETNCTASAGEDGIHNVWTECKPCRHPDCRGRNPLKWVEEKKIHAPDQVEGTVRASGRIFVDPDRDEGYYLLEGPHELSYVASFDLEECEEHQCVGGAVTNTTWDVCRLSVTNTPYLGIDLTDEGKKTNAVGFAEARYGYRPKNTTATYYWEFWDPLRGVISFQDDEMGTAEMETKYTSVPSSKYQGDQVICHATLTETNPPDGHNPCVASADVTSPVTVVKVDVVMDDVDEDKEETEGAMLYYIPDTENGEWTEEGTNELRKIRFVCEPDDGEMLKHEIAVTAPEGLLFEKVGKEYQPAKESYTVEELKKKEFRVHGHRRSEKYLGDEIEAVHVLSGAKDKVKLTIFGRPLLVPDYDRNGNIDETDDARSQDGKTVFRFWINNDDDSDSHDGLFNDVNLNVPEGGANERAKNVSGYSDLEDFTPVKMSFPKAQIFPDGTPDELKNSVKWKLKSSCTGVVWTELGRGNANDFLKSAYDNFGPSLNDHSYKAGITRLADAKDGVEIPKKVLSRLTEKGFEGIVLMEGLAEGSDICIEAVVESKGKESVCLTRGSFLMKIDYIEAMYRWMDLRESLGKSKAAPRNTQWEEEPINGPDSNCNGLPRGNRHWVFAHGFNVNVSEARGWASTVFKRLWQTGDNSRFTFANWAGDNGQFKVIRQYWSIDYYQNSENAFNTAPHFAERCNALNKRMSGGAEVHLIGHSLGNVLISEAIVAHGLNYARYYMVNAAVSKQAYNAQEQESNLLVDPAWRAFEKREYWAWGWHKLFGPGDFRTTLHWPGRYASITNNYNVYSPSDDRLKNLEVSDDKTLSLSSVWVLQERMKGTWKAITANWVDKINPLVPSTAGIVCEGGWGFNGDVYPQYYDGGVLTRAAELTREQVIVNPLFTPFKNHDTKLNMLDLFENKPGDDYQRRLRASLLSDAIPATVYAAGANELAGRDNFNLEKIARANKNWPRADPFWLHSDIKNVCYLFTRSVYEYLAK